MKKIPDGIFNSLVAFSFYMKLFNFFGLKAFMLVFFGFIYRGLQVVIFILVLKIFLIIISGSIDLGLPASLNLNGTNLEYPLMILIVALSFILFIIGNIQTSISNSIKKILMEKFCEILSLGDAVQSKNFAFDQIPIGFDSIVKCYEILLFFVFLLLIIAFISPLLFVFVLVAIPCFAALLVFKSRKEVFIREEYRAKRLGIAHKTDDEITEIIALNNQLCSVSEKSRVLSDTFTGLIMVVCMIFFLKYESNANIVGLKPLVLVFSIRFAMMYARELGMVMNRLLQQRAILKNISIPETLKKIRK